jgi:hypothetical protein
MRSCWGCCGGGGALERGAVRSFHRVLCGFYSWGVSVRISTTDYILIAFASSVIGRMVSATKGGYLSGIWRYLVLYVGSDVSEHFAVPVDVMFSLVYTYHCFWESLFLESFWKRCLIGSLPVMKRSVFITTRKQNDRQRSFSSWY